MTPLGRLGLPEETAVSGRFLHGARDVGVSHQEESGVHGPNVKYVPNNAYADAKLIIAWWVAALARRLPSGMAVVSPGGAADTKVMRNAGPALKYLMIPLVKLIPSLNQTPETAARRYLQASEFGTDVSGQFFASTQGKFSGPIEVQLHPDLHDDRATQEAAWQAIVNVSGVDLSSQP